jgi:phosphate transport system substrate-binding protein
MRHAWLALLLLPLLAPACGGDRRGSHRQIQNKGSDTLVNVAQTWAEHYRSVAPDVVVAVSGGGTGVGVAALLNGTVDLANASREMTESEIRLAREKGFEPVKHLVGYDALAVYVHADNPIPSLTLAQLASVYGEEGDVERWSQLGVEVPGCGSDEIVRVSRQNNSGTYQYFKEAVLGPTHDYRMGSLDQHGSKDVVDLVEKTPCAIGYSGLAYATGHVRTVPVARDAASPPVLPTVTTAVSGEYPIARPLFMYTHGEPAGPVKAYLDWILSDAGQRLLAERGYAPVRDLPR